jgi:predicted SAM-dependent methyltransferase
MTERGETIRIDLGCGPNKMKGYIGIDILPLPGVDIVADFEQGLQFIPDNSVDEIFSSHLLEHVGNFEDLLREIHRVLKPEGIKKIIVPHFSNPYYYSDYTHKKFFGLYSMDYFSDGNNEYNRKVPSFYNDFKFEVVHRKLRFSSPAFYFRNKIKSVFTHIFNSSVYMQELYEDWFTGIIPCAELHFVIRPIKKTV